MKTFKFSSKVREVLTQEELRRIIDIDAEYICICDFYDPSNFLEKEAYTHLSNAFISAQTCHYICKDACDSDIFCSHFDSRVEFANKDHWPGSGSGSKDEDSGNNNGGNNNECSGSGSMGCGSGYCDECSCGCNNLCNGSCSCGNECTCGSVDDRSNR